MEDKDIRWIQRFSNYRKALLQLGKAVDIVSALKSRGDEDMLMEEGLIQRYEYTHELTWKVMKDYLEYQGIPDIVGSRDAIRQTLQAGIISDERWMDSIRNRDLPLTITMTTQLRPLSPTSSMCIIHFSRITSK